MSYASSVLAGTIAKAGVSFDDFVHPLDCLFRLSGGMPKRFRSSLDEPSIANSVQRGAEKIEFPEGIPYVAGFYIGGNLRLTAVQLAPDIIWYGAFTDASIVIRNMEFPQVLIAGMKDRLVSEVISHPALIECDEKILSAHQNGSTINLRLTNSTRLMTREVTKIDEIQQIISLDNRR